MQNVSSGVEKGSVRATLCSTFKAHSAFHDSGLGPSVLALTQSAPSHTSFVSSTSQKEEGRSRVLRELVEVDDGGPFQCYLCGEVISNVHNQVDWRSVYLFSPIIAKSTASGELIHD